ncbi:MAG TPA: hypothetical protein VF530_14745 [Planctomycetota bacterium]
MKPSLAWLLTALLALTPGCIIVHVRGDLDGEFFGDDGDAREFQELVQSLEGQLEDAEYDLDVSASPFHAEAEWTVRYAGSGGHTAFVQAREAVLRRIQRDGGSVIRETSQGPHAWTCAFEVEGEEGEASVRLREEAKSGKRRPHELRVVWEEPD